MELPVQSDYHARANNWVDTDIINNINNNERLSELRSEILQALAGNQDRSDLFVRLINAIDHDFVVRISELLSSTATLDSLGSIQNLISIAFALGYLDTKCYNTRHLIKFTFRDTR